MTELIRIEIERQYGSLLKFCEATGLTYSTLLAGIKRGVESMAYSTVEEICMRLNIRQFRDVYLNEESYSVLEKLKKLDDAGAHTVKAILDVEYERCRKGETVSKSFGGVVKKSIFSEDHIRELVREVLKEQTTSSDAVERKHEHVNRSAGSSKESKKKI